MKTLFTTLLAVVGSCYLTFAPPAQAATSGSGRMASETRALSDFEAIAVNGPIDLTVRQGAKEAVELRGDDNLLPLIETVVESGSNGRTLVVRFKRGEWVRSHGSIKVLVDVVRLGAVASSGSGDVVVEALKTPALKLSLSGSSDARLRALTTDSLDVRISGSGDIGAAGSARRISVSISGSGDADLAGLVADDVVLKIAGSGDANVTANKSLEVSIAGSGDVRYGGDVTAVKTSLAGSGSVKRR